MPTTLASSNADSIDLKKAASIAAEIFNSIYPDLAENDLSLEEVELSEDDKFWLITLGYDAKRVLSPHDKMFKSEKYRAYKTFKIDSSTGKLISMKIRTVD